MHTSTLFAFILYFGAIGSITYVAYNVTHNLSDYILGGRRLSSGVAALSAGASDMSNWLMMALPGAVLAIGLNQIWLPIGLTIGAYLNWLLVGKRLRLYTEVAGNAQTIPAYFHHRFHDHSNILRLLTALVIVIFFTVYIAAGFVGGALLLTTLTQLSYLNALFIGAGIIVSYTVIGGFLAVSWVDTFQGILMLLALLLVPLIAFYRLEHPGQIIEIIQQLNPEKLNIWRELSWLSIISLLAWGLGYFGQPHILVRFMAIHSADEISVARRICIGWMILSLAGAVATGLLGIVYFAEQPLDNPETVMLELIKNLFSPFLIGVLFSAIISAIISTASSQLIAGSSSLATDVYHLILRKKASNTHLLWITRLSTLLMVAVAISIAANPENTILRIVAYAWAGLASSFGPVILISLFWPRMTRNGAVAGMLTGAITTLVWPLLKSLGGLWTVYEIVPGFLLASLAIILVSLLDAPPSLAIQEQFAQVKEKLRARKQ